MTIAMDDLLGQLAVVPYGNRELDARIWAEMADYDVIAASSTIYHARNRKPPNDICILGRQTKAGFYCEGFHRPSIPHYTTNVGDMLALLPRGADYSIQSRARYVQVYSWSQPPHEGVGVVLGSAVGLASVALSGCVAMLKAHGRIRAQKVEGYLSRD